MFALNLMADRSGAFREIHRVVRRGGCAVVGTPASLTRAPAFADVLAIVRTAIPDFEFDGELPLSEAADLQRAMVLAGFPHVDVQTVTSSFQYPSVSVLWSIASRAVAPVVVAREAMGEARWSGAAAEIVAGLSRRFGPGPHAIELSVNLARAHK